MRFRRKERLDPIADTQSDPGEPEAEDVADQAGNERARGPLDSEELPAQGSVERIDLGSLLIEPAPDRELRLQVDQSSGAVQAIHLVGPDGVLELRAFAAPRNGDLWAETRPVIAAEVAQSGGTVTDREGPWGPELLCETGAGDQRQKTRIVGINGPRWMMRCVLLGAPALQPEKATSWEETIRKVVVHRGTAAMPVGEALPVVMPPQARPVGQPNG